MRNWERLIVLLLLNAFLSNQTTFDDLSTFVSVCALLTFLSENPFLPFQNGWPRPSLRFPPHRVDPPYQRLRVSVVAVGALATLSWDLRRRGPK